MSAEQKSTESSVSKHPQDAGSDAAPKDDSTLGPQHSPPEFRWQSFFQKSSEPLFLLNGQRRFLFINRAWEKLTGIPAAEIYRFACIRRAPAADDPWDVVVRSLCCPPPEVLEGRPGQVRRPVPGSDAARRRWDIEFFPLWGADGLLCILGKVKLVVLEGAVAPAPLPAGLINLREQVVQWHSIDGLPVELPGMRRLAEQVRLASQTQVPVLLVGEPGVGKEWLAGAIHYHGAGRERAFMALDCSTLPPAVLATSLFGGGESGCWDVIGTIYLREPAHLPRDLQGRLAQSLAQRGGLHLLAGSSTAPARDVREGRLLEELFGALATLILELAPLRDRLAELPWFVERFMQRICAARKFSISPVADRPQQGVTEEAWAALQAHPWPGNLRELGAVLAGALARSGGKVIDVNHLPVYLRLEPTPLLENERVVSLDKVLEKVERRLIQVALDRSQGSKTRAAEFLSIWRARLLRRMEALGMLTGEQIAEPEE